jgi:PAS domain-containing protein
MTWQLSLPAMAQVVVTGIALGVAYLAWQRRSAPGGRWLALFMLAVAEWSFFEGLQAAAVGIPAKVLLSKIQYPGLVSSAPLMLMAVLSFAGLERLLTRPRLIALLCIPLPWSGNVLYVLGIAPGVDLTPISFGLVGMVLTWGMYRLQLLDLVPVARHTLVENMQDGVLVFDTLGRIVDVNFAAQRLVGLPAGSLVG